MHEVCTLLRWRRVSCDPLRMRGGASGFWELFRSCWAVALRLRNERSREEAPTVTVQVAAAENKAIQRKVTADAILYPQIRPPSSRRSARP